METFLKAVIGILITIILALMLDKQGKDMSVVLVVFVCCVVITAVITYMNPVIDFFRKLQMLSDLDTGMFTVILKAVGIGLLAELTELICADAGKSSLGKSLQILAAAVMLWLSIPLLTQMIDLVESILGAV